MGAALGFLTLADFRRGRNGADPLTSIPDGQCAEAINVDWYRGMLGRRRPGAQAMPGGTPPLDRAILSLIRFIPGRSEKQTQLFAFDRNGQIGHFTGGAGWEFSSPGTLDLTGGVVHGVSFNNKLFLAGQNTTDQLHYWDPLINGTVTVGLPAPTSAPIVSPTGTAGSITGTRYYRIAYVSKSGTVVTQRSEMSAIGSAAITTNLGWYILPLFPFPFDVTHWELYAGATNIGPWYRIATLDVAVTNYTDSVPVASFPPPDSVLAPVIGSHTPAPNGKYLLVDEARLLIAGSFVNADYESRVWWTPIINDASGDGNDERIDAPKRPFIDFDPGDSGEVTGLGGPLFDSPYVFKLDRVYKMVRTGLSGAPYRPVTVSKKCGAIHQRTIVLGEDESGNECLYFLSRRGPYRVGVNGVQYCGRDIEDLWAQVDLNAAVGSATNAGAHGVYHGDVHQVWWWVPTTGDCPSLKLVFDTRLGQFTSTDGARGGWAQHTGPSALAWASSMFGDVLTDVIPNDDSLALKPYLSQAGVEPGDDLPRVWMADYGDTDNGEGYQGLLRSAAIVVAETVALHGGVIEAHVVISAGSFAFTLATLRDYGLEVRTSDLITVVPAGVPRVIKPVRDLAAVSAAVVQIEFADTLLSELWELDQIVMRVRREEDR